LAQRAKPLAMGMLSLTGFELAFDSFECQKKFVSLCQEITAHAMGLIFQTDKPVSPIKL